GRCQLLERKRGLRIVDGGQRRGGVGVDRCRPSTLRAQVRVEAIAHDREQPALEVGAGRELFLLVEGRENRVLHEIVSGLTLAAQEPRKRAKVRKQRHDVVLYHRAWVSRDE